MIESEYPIVLEHFDEISSLLSKDLCWYLVYEAILNVSESLHIEGDVDLPPNKMKLYHCAASYEICRLLEKHVFDGRPVEITQAFYEEAAEYYALHVPGEPTHRLSGYLNYLDSWCETFADWKTASPASYDSLEIAISL